MCIFKRVKELICEHLQIDELEMDKTSSLIELGMTSLTFVQMIVAFETAFGITFDDDDFNPEKFKSVHDFYSYIKHRIIE